MISLLISTKKCIPFDYKKTIYDIDFNKLYELGKRLILIDLDNTMISYRENLADERLKEFIKEVSKKFEFIIVSNNRKERVSNFSNDVGKKFVYSSRKPRRKGFRKALKIAENKYEKNEIVLIGDQIMTDVYGGNRFKIDVIVVDAIERKSEKWYTRLNRRIEKKKMKHAYKKYKVEFERLKLGEKI